MYIRTDLFLQTIHTGEKEICFRAISSSKPINIKGTYEEKSKYLYKLNQEGYNIYFVVNGGGTHSYEINKINAVFIDFDCPKELRYSDESIQKYKDDKLNIINSYSYKPTFIVETKNGLHIYWCLYEGATTNQYIQCQLQLIGYFKSDEAVKTLERIMRLPNYNWVKDINNPFKCEIIQYNDIRYDIQDIINNLPLNDNVIKDINKQQEKKDGDKRPQYMTNTKDIIDKLGTDIPCNENNINTIKNKDFATLQSKLNIQNNIVFDNYNDIYNYLKKQDLCEFLGLPSRFNCLFHQDKHPSANIYIDYKTGFHWYKCFSPKCGKTRDIISIVEFLLKCSTPKALKFLCQVYKIEFIESEWQKEQKEILEENKRLLRDIERFEQLAPLTYKRIKNYITSLILVNDVAKDFVFSEKYSTNTDERPLFFISLKELAKTCGKKDLKTMSNLMSLFAYLGLVDKLPESEIPEEILNKAKLLADRTKNLIIKRSAEKHDIDADEIDNLKDKLNIPMVNFYSIPSYNSMTLEYSDCKSEEFTNLGFTMRGWSREMILRALGEVEANRVFPQMKEKPISELNENAALAMEQILLNSIRIKGYVTEDEIIYNTYLHFQNHFSEYKYKQKQIKRVLPEILLKYDLVKVKLNNELKKKYNIDIKGFPNIITKNN